MEGWSNLIDGSPLHEVGSLQDSREKQGSAFDNDFSLLECGFDECKNKLRGLFNQVLVKFLERKGVTNCIKPLPALCSNGKPVDFFKLFWVVRKLGGYDSISRENLWDFVAEECGLGFGVMASVKLIYTKYLSELDHWLWQGLKDRKFLDDGDRVIKNLEDLLQDLMKEFGDFRDERWKKGKGDVNLLLSDIGKCGNGLDTRKRLVLCSSNKDMNEVYDRLEKRYGNVDGKHYLDSDNSLVESAKQVIHEVNGFSEGRTCDDNKTCSQRGTDVIESTKKAVEKAISWNTHHNADVKEKELFPLVSELSSNKGVDKVVDSRKRKREYSSMTKMLCWVKNVAKNSDDVAIGRIPYCSKWKNHGKEELWLHALLARESQLIKRQSNLSVESSLQQKKLKMHPSMYEEDALNHQSVEKSRCSQRLPLVKSHFCSCCNVTSQSMVLIHQKTEAELPSSSVASSDIVGKGFMDEPSEEEALVGPLFQAEVPKWTGEVFESDTKWLGIRVWPPECVEDKRVIECDPIGAGRANACDCSFPGHTECIRFHIAEKRLKLKRELGVAFYKWRFDRIGEEVSLSWTMEEEKRFKDMIKLNSDCTNKFWRNAFKLFPSKTREELVRYYYNVFLVRRRSYQNRVTPKDVDSDDDEKELGSIGDNFGYKAIHVPEMRLPACSENRQCSELE